MILATALLLLTGLDPEPARAMENLTSYFSDDDYPVEAIRKEEQGTVRFRLEVDRNGTVERCTVTSSSNSPSLDETTCRIVSERARFAPARNEHGETVRDTVSSSIRWVIPSDPPLQRTTFTAADLRKRHYIWEVTADGKERSCRGEFHYQPGIVITTADCAPLDRTFVAAAAAYLKALPTDLLTLRLEQELLLDSTLPFAPFDTKRGELLVRAEGDYRIGEGGTVDNCVVGRRMAVFNWETEPCLAKTFAGKVPVGTREMRLAVQWVVTKGPDTMRPKAFPAVLDVGSDETAPEGPKKVSSSSPAG